MENFQKADEISKLPARYEIRFCNETEIRLQRYNAAMLMAEWKDDEYMNVLNGIKEVMSHLLFSDKSGKFRPIKGTTKQDCYDALGEIQTILKTNEVHYDEQFMKGRVYEQRHD